jgi:hypothetical protein
LLARAGHIGFSVWRAIHARKEVDMTRQTEGTVPEAILQLLSQPDGLSQMAEVMRIFMDQAMLASALSGHRRRSLPTL